MYHFSRSSGVTRLFTRTWFWASAIGLLWILPAFAQDVTAPVLTAFTFSSTTVNTTSGSATVRASFTATDDLSGVNAIQVTWYNPSQTVWYSNFATFAGPLQVSATISVVIPQFSEEGTWTPTVELVDEAGNDRLMYSASIAALGFPTKLTVVSKGDTTPPVLTAFSFSPASVNTNSGSATILTSFSATDDLSGISGIEVAWYNPSQSVWFSNIANFNGQLQVSGTVSVVIPQFSQAGTWTPRVGLIDKTGNVRPMSSADIAALGFPTNLTVVSQGDTVPPVLTAFAFSPANVNTTSGSATAQASFTVTDDLSGVSAVAVTWFNPSQSVSYSNIATFNGPLQAAGFVSVVIPQFSQGGIWTPKVGLADQTGNIRLMSSADIAALGFPTKLTVVSGNTITASPPSLTFNWEAGQPAPAPQNIVISSPVSGLSLSAAAAGSWLSVSPTSATTPATFSVSVNPSGLSAGKYNGTVTISSLTASPVSIPVTLTVTAGTLAASPQALTFNYSPGNTSAPAAQNVSISSPAGGTPSWTATASAPWVVLSSTSGTVPGTLSISVNPANLAAATYSANVQITPGGNASPVPISITLVIGTAAASPVISSLNPGSAIAGGPAFVLTVNGAGFLSGATVQWNGSPLPTIFVSANQLTASVAASLIASYGSVSITAVNPGGISSNANTLPIGPPGPAITPSGVVPIYSSVPVIQPGSWVSIYGTGLADGTFIWNGDFPTTLHGTSVTINGKPAYLFYVSPGQIDVQAPDDTATGPVSVVVKTASGEASATVTLGNFGPSFSLVDAKHVAGIIIRPDGSGAYGFGAYDIIGPTGNSLGYPTVAAKAGDTIELFGVGFGPTDPFVSAGRVFSGAAAATNPVALVINNLSVQPLFAGLSSAGLYQINLTIPAGLGTGDVPLLATVGGVQSPSNVVISLQ